MRKTATTPMQQAGTVIHQDKGQAVRLVQVAHLSGFVTYWLTMHGQLYIGALSGCATGWPGSTLGWSLGYPVVQWAGPLCIEVEFSLSSWPVVQRGRFI